MVCVVCLDDFSPIALTMEDIDGDIEYEVTLCREHGIALQNIIKKWMLEKRQTTE